MRRLLSVVLIVLTPADGAETMGLQEGLALLGLYKAYLADVRNEICPRDVLGNDEFGFFGALG